MFGNYFDDLTISLNSHPTEMKINFRLYSSLVVYYKRSVKRNTTLRRQQVFIYYYHSTSKKLFIKIS